MWVKDNRWFTISFKEAEEDETLCPYHCMFCGAGYPIPLFIMQGFMQPFDTCCPKPIYGPPKPMMGFSMILGRGLSSVYLKHDIYEGLV